jgi:type I restriction enzyme S subunit
MLLLQYFNELTIRPENAEKLKGLILELAVRGKLTQQWRAANPNTASAQQLLEAIKAEKKQLIAEKKIRKEKPLPKIEAEEIPFDLPESWVWTRLQEYLDVRDGTHNTPKYVSQGVPLVTSKNLYTKKLNISNVKYISIEDHIEISKRSKVDFEDILFAMIGTIGNPVIVDIEPNFSIKNVALIKYYNKKLCIPKFILYYLEKATEDFKNNADGAVQSFVSLKKLRLSILPLPPLEEQKAIVKIVEQLFQEVENLTALTKQRLTVKEAYVQSILQNLETGNTEQVWQNLVPNFPTFFDTVASVKALRQTVL